MKHSTTWPELSYEQWSETRQTLQLWTQIVGKIRLSKSPWLNHSWSATYYVSARGLTTGLIHDDGRSYSLEFDLIAHELRFFGSNGKSFALPLSSHSVASFYQACEQGLGGVGVEMKIYPFPNEVAELVAFAEDVEHCTYDAEQANRFWHALLAADRVLKVFRSRFIGKASPVHFFWGGFDLAVTRFSGRRAPQHPGGIPHLPDLVTREAYSHEVSSCGFWPGDARYPQAAFYSYAYPSPEGFATAAKLPKGAIFHEGLREFILPYDLVRTSRYPDELVLEFCQSTYEAAAKLARWDRDALENSEYLAQLQSA